MFGRSDVDGSFDGALRVVEHYLDESPTDAPAASNGSAKPRTGVCEACGAALTVIDLREVSDPSVHRERERRIGVFVAVAVGGSTVTGFGGTTASARGEDSDAAVWVAAPEG